MEVWCTPIFSAKLHTLSSRSIQESFRILKSRVDEENTLPSDEGIGRIYDANALLTIYHCDLNISAA
jgi:hypothetical protein